MRRSPPDAAPRLDVLRPTPRLSPCVERFNAYSDLDMALTRRREMPDGLATLLFNLGDELRIEHPAAERTSFPRGSAFFSGASATYAVSEMERAQQGVQVMLTPLGARLLLGMPLAEVGDRLTDPADLLGPVARETLDRLQEASAHRDRLAILERAIAARLAEAPVGPPADVAWALGRLRATGGRVRIDRLASEIGCSRKHLTVRFSREFGMAPKTMARVLRFARALRRVRRDQAVSWAALAADCGYADQPHLGREFREMSGASPGALAARALPDDAGFAD